MILSIFPNLFSLLFLLTFIANIVLLLVILFRRKGEGGAMLWFIFLISIGSVWSLAQLMLSGSQGETFAFWYAVTELMVTSLMPVFTLFVLTLVGKEKTLQQFSGIITIALLTFALLFLYWRTDLVTIHDFGHAIATPWGYQYPRQPIPWDIFIISAFCLYNVYQLVSYYIHQTNPIRRQTVKVITIAFILPIFGGLLLQGIVPAVTRSAEFPATAPLLFITSFIIATTLLKRGWGAFSTETVSPDIIQIIPGSVVILDSFRQIQGTNSTFLDFVGKRQEDVVGTPFLAVVPDEAERQVLQHEVFEKLERGYDVVNTNIAVVGRGGTPVPLAVRATARRDSGGNLLNIFLVLMDSSMIQTKEHEALAAMKRAQEQNKLLEDNKVAMLNLLEDSRQLEEQIRDERDRATAILSLMSEGLCVVDKDAKIIVVNNTAMSLLGFTEKQMLYAKYPEIIHLYKAGNPVRNDAERPVTKTLQTGTPLSGGLEDNYQYQCADGKLIPIAWSTVALKRGEKIVGEIITFHDISRDLAVKATIEQQVVERTRELTDKNIALEKAQKQVTEGWLQQQREKARLTASINSLSLGFILTDMEDHIVTMNPAAQGIIGLSTRADDLRVIEGLLQGVVDIHKLHEQCHLEQKPIHVESVLYGRKYLRLFLAPIVLFTNQEEHIGTVILIEDVSEAKTLERSREEFFSIASHELRTPLTAIRGNTSLIKEHYFDKLEPDLQEMINDIHESSVRLIDIVNDFLSMTRLEQQRLEFKKESFDIEDLIKNAIKEYQVTTSRQRLSLDFEEPPAPMPAVFADPERVRQVLINLLGNALKFTEHGGVKVGLARIDNMVEVTVSDTGRGIPAENQSLLFHKFQQAGDSLFTRDTTKGTGLGLYISKLIIEAMGGKIWLLKSEADKGSVFAFTVPIAKKAEETAEAAGVVQEKPPVTEAPAATEVVAKPVTSAPAAPEESSAPDVQARAQAKPTVN